MGGVVFPISGLASDFINPCVINGSNYVLERDGHPYKNNTGDSLFSNINNFYISSLTEKKFERFFDVDTIKKSTRIETYASRHLRDADINIFFVGQNGGYSSIEELVKQIGAMVQYAKSPNYIVLSFHHTNDIVRTIPEMERMEHLYETSFVKHYINLRDSLLSLNFEENGFSMSVEDQRAVERGEVPEAMMIDGLHFKPETYKNISLFIFNKLKELGY